jgi:D-galactose 1-dehydrogenase
VTAATLDFPANRFAPIAAELTLSDETGLPIRAEFDFLQTGPQTWDIYIETDAGKLVLSSGGAKLLIDGQPVVDDGIAEYITLYKRFADLIARGESDVDLSPLGLVADAFLLGRRRIVTQFED